MADTTAVYARIDTSLKNHTEGILRQSGITPSSAIQMLYSQIVLTKWRPSAIRTGYKPVRLKGRRPAKEGGNSKCRHYLMFLCVSWRFLSEFSSARPGKTAKSDSFFFTPVSFFRFYSYLSASIGLRFAARADGISPKRIPTAMEKSTDTMIAGTLTATGILAT